MMEDTKALTTGLTIVMVLGFGLIGAGAVQAADASVMQVEENTTVQNETCEGTPQLARVSITSPQNQITDDQVGVVEANFRVDENIPQDCTVVVDLQYSFSQSGFQFEGGSDWEQSATDIVATQFELGAGDIRSIDAEISSNGAEVGDEVTVQGNYEIWYEGDRDNSHQQTVRKTLEVTDEVTQTAAPDDSGADEGESDPNEEQTGNQEQTTTTTGGESPWDNSNFILLVAVVGLILIAVVLAWKGPDIITLISE